ncbi:hypothetical protein JYT71_00710 [Acidimicrobiaceae bacterium AH-315-P05]|nr:hypothetical protein [Acidimicrobiaceae bacterium AH-315-P05]
MQWKRYGHVARREAHYAFQKVTGVGLDTDFELTLGHQADEFLGADRAKKTEISTVGLDEIEARGSKRLEVFREDVYRRFVVDADGSDHDQFGRRGKWIPRGSVVYYDRVEESFVKVFDEYASVQGEARFLGVALAKGMYDFLCPGLTYRILDNNDVLRGYAIREGTPLSKFEFEVFVGSAFREVILAETERTGFYFNDLAFHNVVRRGDRLMLIDLESVLPVSWFETDLEFARLHLDEVDLGWPIQSKWRSPGWYGSFLRELKAQPVAEN